MTDQTLQPGAMTERGEIEVNNRLVALCISVRNVAGLGSLTRYENCHVLLADMTHDNYRLAHVRDAILGNTKVHWLVGNQDPATEAYMGGTGGPALDAGLLNELGTSNDDLRKFGCATYCRNFMRQPRLVAVPMRGSPAREKLWTRVAQSFVLYQYHILASPEMVDRWVDDRGQELRENDAARGAHVARGFHQAAAGATSVGQLARISKDPNAVNPYVKKTKLILVGRSWVHPLSIIEID